MKKKFLSQHCHRYISAKSLLRLFLLTLLVFTPFKHIYGYDKHDFQETVKKAYAAPSICDNSLSDLQPLFTSSWIKAHNDNPHHKHLSDEVSKFSEIPDISAPDYEKILSSQELPKLNFPPYLQRTCHVKVQKQDGQTEDGFLVLAFYIHHHKISNFFVRWDSQETVSQDFRHFQKEINNDHTDSDPDLRQCRKKYPRISFEHPTPELDEASFDIRSRLIVHCVEDQHALEHIYSDSFFIHR